MKALLGLSEFLRPAVIPLARAPANPTLVPPSAIDGNILDLGTGVGMFNLIANGGMHANGNVNYNSASGATITLTNLGLLSQLLTAGSAVTVTIDSAYNIVLNLASPYLGQTFPFMIVTTASTTVATPTLSDTAVTLAGTTSVLAAAARWYQAQITQLTTTSGLVVNAGTTFTSLTQVGTTNTYTVALGTNTVVPTVGQAVFINVTAGTLPSGWYPINKESSATSFVIAAPAASTAWTATAATIPGTAVAPNVLSPLITITGMFATVTATMGA